MSLSIESVNIINLRRRPDLAYAQQGAWQARGCPSDKIHIFEAHDGLEYTSRGEIAQAAADDGFPFFNWYVDREDQNLECWMGIGELACMWSIAALLREIANKEGTNAHFYVLADRFLRKKFWEAEALINELPNFNFMQFRGYISLNPIQSRDRPPVHWYDESRGIEHNGFKIGDGLLLMTPAGADWMLTTPTRIGMNDAPYELILMHMAWGYEHAGPIVEGAYSMAGPTCSFEEWYSNEQWNYVDWEGQFDYKSVLGKSDIDYINERKSTQNK